MDVHPNIMCFARFLEKVLQALKEKIAAMGRIRHHGEQGAECGKKRNSTMCAGASGAMASR